MPEKKVDKIMEMLNYTRIQKKAALFFINCSVCYHLCVLLIKKLALFNAAQTLVLLNVKIVAAAKKQISITNSNYSLTG